MKIFYLKFACVFFLLFGSVFSSSSLLAGKVKPLGIGSGIAIGLGAGILDFILLSQTTPESKKLSFVRAVRTQVTAMTLGLGMTSVLSTVPPIQVMGLGLLGYSAWGHRLCWKDGGFVIPWHKPGQRSMRPR